MNIFNHPKILLAFKAAVFLVMTWYITDRLFLSNDFNAQFSLFKGSLQSSNVIYAFIAVLLMPLNWGIETLKWKWLINSTTSFTNLLQSVIAGITFGFITPARSGEFIGRVMYLNDTDKTKVFYLSSIGGIAQTAVTLVAGVFCVMLWSSNSMLNGLTVGVAVSFLFFYFRFDLFNQLISCSNFLSRKGLLIQNDELPAIETQLKVLFASLVRYLVYLIQYVLVLRFFEVSDSLLMLTVYSGVFLMAQTFSPLMPFLDISFRGGSMLYVFKDTDSNSVALLSVVTLVWFINLLIPALMGYLFILRKKGYPKSV